MQVQYLLSFYSICPCKRDLIVCSLGSSAGFVFWRSSVYSSRSIHHLFPPCSVSLRLTQQTILQVSLPSASGKNHQENCGRESVRSRVFILCLLPIVLSVSLTEDWNLDCLLLILISLTSFQVCYMLVLKVLPYAAHNCK